MEAVAGTNNAAHHGRLTVGHVSTTLVILFNTPTLPDLVKVEFSALDHWFEEDTPIYCHPKDPYKRIDILSSTRNVRIALEGVTLAESTSPLLLLGDDAAHAVLRAAHERAVGVPEAERDRDAVSVQGPGRVLPRRSQGTGVPGSGVVLSVSDERERIDSRESVLL